MFNRPTLADITQRLRTETLSRLPADDVLRRADAEVLARVLAGAAHGLYGYLAYLADQVIYDTAAEEYLLRWCSIWDVPRNAATAAQGVVTFTGQESTPIPTGALAKSPITGRLYQTSADAVITTGRINVAVVAMETGAAGNLLPGDTLNMVSPIAGILPAVTVVQIDGGADIESIDSLRAKLLERIQKPPQGGAAYDYVQWAKQIAGVTRAWVYPQELGPGTVTVRYVRDNDGGGDRIIPTSENVALVQSHIDPLKPVTAAVHVVAPIADPINFEIELDTLNLTAQNAIAQELQSMITRYASPGGTVLLKYIKAAISSVVDENYTLLAPTANVVNTTGRISVMGEIAWS